MANMTSDTLTKSNGTMPEFKNKMQMTEQNLEKLSQDVGERIGSSTAKFASSASEYLKTGREYVHANPVKGVAIAAVAGVALGSLIAVTMGRRH
ncbi:MAG: hypothetical protein AABY64_03645 [Bdellovibrionota bacterium]